MQIGKHSPRLVQLRKAIRQGTLTDEGLLPIEGPILLEEARLSGLQIAEVFVRSGTTFDREPIEQVYEIPNEIFKTLQETEHSQGILATVRLPGFRLSDVLNTVPALIIILGRLQDPGNVGTILRLGEAFGATGCVALTGTASFHNGKVLRASAGSVFRMPHVAGADLAGLTGALKASSIRLVGTSPAAHSSIEEWDWRTPTAILVGNEGSGLSSEEQASCDTVLRIPHCRTVESLNSAIATAVILYEASRQRR
jgi:TrmH family RNA methyltransferase